MLYLTVIYRKSMACLLVSDCLVAASNFFGHVPRSENIVTQLPTYFSMYHAMIPLPTYLSICHGWSMQWSYCQLTWTWMITADNKLIALPTYCLSTRLRRQLQLYHNTFHSTPLYHQWLDTQENTCNARNHFAQRRSHSSPVWRCRTLKSFVLYRWHAELLPC